MVAGSILCMTDRPDSFQRPEIVERTLQGLTAALRASALTDNEIIDLCQGVLRQSVGADFVDGLPVYSAPFNKLDDLTKEIRDFLMSVPPTENINRDDSEKPIDLNDIDSAGYFIDVCNRTGISDSDLLEMANSLELFQTMKPEIRMQLVPPKRIVVHFHLAGQRDRSLAELIGAVIDEYEARRLGRGEFRGEHLRLNTPQEAYDAIVLAYRRCVAEEIIETNPDTGDTAY